MSALTQRVQLTESVKRSSFSGVTEAKSPGKSDGRVKRGLEGRIKDAATTAARSKSLFQRAIDWGFPPPHKLKDNANASIKKQWEAQMRTLVYTRQQWRLILLLQVLTIVPAFLDTKNPKLEKNLFDAAYKGDLRDYSEVMQSYIIVQVADLFLTPLSDFVNMLVEKRVSDAIKMDLFRKVVTSDIQFFEHYNSGELAMLFNRNVSAVRRAATGQNFTNPLKQIIKGFGHTYALYLLSPEITYYLLLLIPFYMISDYFFHIFNRAIDRKEEKKMAKRSNISSEIIQGIATVKAFNTEDKEIASYQKHVNELSHQLGRRSLFHIAERTVHEILNISKVLIVLGLSQQIMLAQMGNQQASEENAKIQPLFTSGVIATIFRYSASLVSLYAAIRNLLSNFLLSRTAPAMEKVFEVLEYEPKIRNDTGEELNTLSGHFEFINVSFSYPSAPNVQVLRDVSFEIRPGDYVAFAGSSGSGKSTIVKLIERFYDVESGVIRVDGRHIRDIRLPHLRSKIGMVTQNPMLFNNTMRYNITYGCKVQPTEEEILDVCRRAGCESFIQNKQLFPLGLQTIVGEKGSKISGGQLQRIAIARALMFKPSVLIFDEATSSLDAETEYQVQSSIDQLVSQQTNITIIVIAHRLSTIVNCHKIFVLQDGRIAESGNHRELQEKKGVYFNLVQRQLNRVDSSSRKSSRSSNSDSESHLKDKEIRAGSDSEADSVHEQDD